MPQVGIGEKIPLYMYLEDKDPAKFPQATVKKPDGTAVTGSPVDMASIGDGSYRNITIDMPDEEFVVSEFVVYDDAARTIESVIHFPTSELYEKDFSAEVLEGNICSKLNQIITNLQNVSGSLATVDVEVLATQIEGTILLAKELQAEIGDDEIEGTISSENELSGEVDDNDIEIKIDKC